VDDYYSPEVNSNIIALPGVTTADGISCSPIPDNTGGDWTTSFTEIKCYDQLKVNAVLNWIQGKNHLGTSKTKVPTIFGMNFQAVSVGQKLIEGGVKGGYMDAAGTPTAHMKSAIEFADAAIGQMVEELKDQGLSDSTLIIVTAKHGQSPIDTHRFFEPANTPADILANAPGGSLIPFSESPNNPTGIGPTQDDISQLWLTHSSDTLKAVGLLEDHLADAAISQIFYGPSLETMFNAPGLPPLDPRTPDIIVQPNVGAIYSGSHKKQAEHGGFANDDTNVMMLVSNPRFDAKTVTSFVETIQVAPTILKALGLDPNDLDAVRKEGTPVLPGLNFNE
jgi:hypothetical protein